MTSRRCSRRRTSSVPRCARRARRTPSRSGDRGAPRSARRAACRPRRRAVGPLLRRDAARRGLRAIATTRSLSFTRSSAAPLTDERPSAAVAAITHAGTSSISRGAHSAGTSNARAGGQASHGDVADGLPASSCAFAMLTSAPMAASTSSSPVRVGLRFMPSSGHARARSAAAAARKNAADASPGTRVAGMQPGRPARVKAAPCARPAPGVTSSATPVRGRHALGVVARRAGQAHFGRAVGRESREQHASRDLRAPPPARRTRCRAARHR